MEVHVLYKEFTDRSAAASEMVQYLGTLLNLVTGLIINIIINIINIIKHY